MNSLFNAITLGELEFLNKLHTAFSNGFMDSVMPVCGVILGIVIWAAASVIMIFLRKTRQCGITLFAACSVTFLAAHVFLKHAIIRERPFTLIDPSIFSNASGRGSSFPSSHVAIVFTAAAVFLFYNVKAAIAAYVAGIITAFSRLYIYAHYPSDVIAGMIIGTVIGILTVLVVRKIIGKKNKGNIYE